MKKVLIKIGNWFSKLINKIRSGKTKKVFEKIRSLSLLLAGSITMLACIVFVFATDLFATNNSIWLLCGSLLGFGAGIIGLVSEINKENKALTFSLKGVSLVLMIGFVVFLTFFEKSPVVTSLDETKKFYSLIIKNLFNKPNDYQGFECLKAIKASMVVTYIFAYLGLSIQAINITSNALIGIEE